MADTPRPPLPQRRRPNAMADYYRREAQKFLQEERQAVHEGLTDEQCAVFLGRAVALLEALVAALPHMRQE